LNFSFGGNEFLESNKTKRMEDKEALPSKEELQAVNKTFGYYVTTPLGRYTKLC